MQLPRPPERKAPRGCRGFTLPEILIALAIGLLVLGLVIGLWRASALGLFRAEVRADPRERAHLALLAMRLALIDSFHCTVSPGEDAVTFLTPAKEGEIRYDASRRTLRLRAPGEKEMRDLVKGDLGAFRVRALQPGFLEINLELTRPTAGPLKIQDEIFIPAIASRDPRRPFNRVLEHPRALE